MPINQINTNFTAPQDTAITGAYATMNTNFPFAVALNDVERKSLKSIADVRYPYVQRTMDIHIVNFPNLVTGFAGTAAEAQTDWALIKLLDKYEASAEIWLEKIRDTRRLAKHELYTFLLNVYEMAKNGARNNVPGMDTVAEDLKQLFANQGNAPADDGTPTPQ